MREKSGRQTKNTTLKPAVSLSQSRILQRQCACGGVPGLTGQCEECNSKLLSGQERATNLSPIERDQVDQMSAVTPTQQLPGHSFGRMSVQAKLAIGMPGDKYEQEADRLASQVVQQIHAPAIAYSNQRQALQRQEEADEELQAKPSISHLQRSQLFPEEKLEDKPEEEDIQAKSIVQRREASTDLASAINNARGSGQPLDAGLQRSMGQAMGADFRGVKVHTDAQSDQLNQSIQAKAFTTGQDVFFRQGAYQPGSRGGQELIAHELTHVVQQAKVRFNLLDAGNAHAEAVQRFKMPDFQGTNKVVNLGHLPASSVEYTSVFRNGFKVPNQNKALLGNFLEGDDPINTKLSIALQSINEARGNIYERCHLIAKTLGGKGQEDNIVPALASTNKNILDNVEKPIINSRKQEQKRFFEYQVTAEYGDHKNPNLTKVEEYLPLNFKFALTEYHWNGKQPSTNRQNWYFYQQVDLGKDAIQNNDLTKLLKLDHQRVEIQHESGTLEGMAQYFANEIDQQLSQMEGVKIMDINKAKALLRKHVIQGIETPEVQNALPRDVIYQLSQYLSKQVPVIVTEVLDRIEEERANRQVMHLADLEQMRPTSGIQIMIQTLRNLIEASKNTIIEEDEPYYYYGRLKW